MLHITLKGGDVREVAENTTAEELCRDISMGLFRAACAVRIDGAVCDLRTPLTRDCAVEFLTFEDEDGRKAFRHTASHILAQAVLHLFPGVKFAIGPAIDNGFYYGRRPSPPTISRKSRPKWPVSPRKPCPSNGSSCPSGRPAPSWRTSPTNSS